MDKREDLVWASAFGAAWVMLSDPQRRPAPGDAVASILWRRGEAKRLADEALQQYLWVCPEGRD